MAANAQYCFFRSIYYTLTLLGASHAFPGISRNGVEQQPGSERDVTFWPEDAQLDTDRKRGGWTTRHNGCLDSRNLPAA